MVFGGRSFGREGARRCGHCFGFGVNLFHFAGLFRGSCRRRKLFLVFRLSGTHFGFRLFWFFFRQFVSPPQSCDMFGSFLRDVRGKLRALGGAAGFHLGNIFGAKPGSGLSRSFP